MPSEELDVGHQPKPDRDDTLLRRPDPSRVEHGADKGLPDLWENLAGDSERVAITCAALGVRADELELPVPLDKLAYRRALGLLEQRAIVENGRLTAYGRKVEAMPVERPWA